MSASKHSRSKYPSLLPSLTPEDTAGIFLALRRQRYLKKCSYTLHYQPNDLNSGSADGFKKISAFYLKHRGWYCQRAAALCAQLLSILVIMPAAFRLLTTRFQS